MSDSVPAARGIHRRAHAVRGALADQGRAAKPRAVLMATIVLLAALAATGAAPAPTVAIAALLIWLSATLSTNGLREDSSIYVVTLMAGAWMALAPSLWPALFGLTWLPVFATSQIRLHVSLALFFSVLALDVLVHLDAHSLGLSLLLTLSTIVSAALGHALLSARVNAAEAAFDHAELEAVIVALQTDYLASPHITTSPSANTNDAQLENPLSANVPERTAVVDGFDGPAANALDEALVGLSPQLRIAGLNTSASRLLGQSAQQLVGRVFAEVAVLRDSESQHELTSALESCAIERQQIELPDGTELSVGGIDFAVAGRIVPLTDNNCLLILRDVGEIRDAERMAHFYATHDAITGLPGLRQLQSDLRSLQQRQGCRAVCLIDFDHFTSISESVGYESAMALMRDASTMLLSQLSADDALYCINIDGFVALVERESVAQVELFAESLRGAIATLVASPSSANPALQLNVSVGIAALGDVPISPDATLAAASIARSFARNQGGNRCVLFAPDNPKIREQSQITSWTSRVQAALSEDRLTLYLQPIAALRPELEQRAELLLRLQDETGEVWKPEHFLPAAERHQLMGEIDRWVVNRVVTALENNAADLRPWSSIALNLSGQSLSDADFRNYVLERLSDAPDVAARICFEVTETSLLTEIDDVAMFFKLLRALGCSVALDDFGAGYSSYGYLKRLPADVLKIDGSFVVEMQRNPVDRAMVDSINRLAHRLGMRTVAEFVGNKATLETLRELGVDYAQGEFIGAPQRIDTGV